MLKKPLVTDLSQEDLEDEHEPARKHLVGVYAVLLATTLYRIDSLTDRLADGLDVEEWAAEFRDERKTRHRPVPTPHLILRPAPHQRLRAFFVKAS